MPAMLQTLASWRIAACHTSFPDSMRFCPAHACTLQGAIHRIVLALGDREGTTACSDGSCILWDLETFKRRRILAAGSSIADACYSSDQSQLITAGMSHQSWLVLSLHACVAEVLKASRAYCTLGQQRWHTLTQHCVVAHDACNQLEAHFQLLGCHKEFVQ